MIRSMTAFGRSTLKSEGGALSCEISSVNHRFLDISVRLPEGLRMAEPELRSLIGQALTRGKVEVAVTLSARTGGEAQLDINTALLQELVNAANSVATLTSDTCTVDSVALLRWPGVIKKNSDSVSVSLAEVHQVAELALHNFIASREREGEQLAKVLKARNQRINVLLKKLTQQRPQVLHRQRTRLVSKLNQLSSSFDVGRLEQEMVYAAQRLDIDEELERLQAHTRELDHALEHEDIVGRRLNFLMQEYNRETNTISSKASDTDTTSMAVEMKVIIEQMREQIQNIE